MDSWGFLGEWKISNKRKWKKHIRTINKIISLSLNNG
jgi:hypothetical protein